MGRTKRALVQHPTATVRGFFARSDYLDRMALRPLSHIAGAWDACWDDATGLYEPEEDSFAEDLNFVIETIASMPRPVKYHDDEDVLAENLLRELRWPIQKKGGCWIGADYAAILEQGSFSDYGQKRLLSAATGRAHAALDFGQVHFDEMEEGHMNMLAQLIVIIVYHRYNTMTSLFRDKAWGEST